MNIETRNNFLNSIKGNKLKYKRVSITPIRYAGGKSLAVGYICELIPTNVDKVVSPFFGGGSIEFAISKGLKIPVIGYDIFPDLVNFWNVLKKNKKKLITKLRTLEPTKEEYNKVKTILKNHWDNKDKNPLNKIDWATYFYFNHNLSYGPSFLGWMSKKYEDKELYEKLLKNLNNINMDNIQVKCSSFEKILNLYKDDFLYLDPPYFLNGTSKMFAGIYPQRNFPIYHNNFNHLLLNQMLKKHKGGFILSYNDCQEIRELYKDYKIIDVKWQYTMGQGETRIGKNRKENNLTNKKDSHEILIIKEREI